MKLHRIPAFSSTAILGGALFGLASCIRPVPAPRPATSLEERIAGCYSLQPGPWQTDSLLAIPFTPLRAPTRFRLEVARLAGWDPLQSDALPLYEVRTYPEAGQASSMFTYWQRRGVGSDTIRISYPLPFAGVGLLLTPAGRDLVGRIYTFTDALREDQPSYAEAPIRARRILCPPV